MAYKYYPSSHGTCAKITEVDHLFTHELITKSIKIANRLELRGASSPTFTRRCQETTEKYIAVVREAIERLKRSILSEVRTRADMAGAIAGMKAVEDEIQGKPRPLLAQYDVQGEELQLTGYGVQGGLDQPSVEYDIQGVLRLPSVEYYILGEKGLPPVPAITEVKRVTTAPMRKFKSVVRVWRKVFTARTSPAIEFTTELEAQQVPAHRINLVGASQTDPHHVSSQREIVASNRTAVIKARELE
jgi:chorismate mutase